MKVMVQVALTAAARHCEWQYWSMQSQLSPFGSASLRTAVIVNQSKLSLWQRVTVNQSSNRLGQPARVKETQDVVTQSFSHEIAQLWIEIPTIFKSSLPIWSLQVLTPLGQSCRAVKKLCDGYLLPLDSLFWYSPVAPTEVSFWRLNQRPKSLLTIVLCAVDLLHSWEYVTNMCGYGMELVATKSVVLGHND